MDSILEKPFSQASENNKAPILAELTRLFSHNSRILEIGSGTGQHAVHFASAMPHLEWQTSDRKINLEGIRLWIEDARLSNIGYPIELDVNQQKWPTRFDGVFSANTAHIMPWISVVVMITRIGDLLPRGGTFVLYGPFKYKGHYTTESNERFDEWLKSQARHQGIRDFESVVEVASSVGLQLQQDISMPANNQLLVWKKTG